MQIKIGEKVVDVKKQTWPVAKEPPQKEEFQKQATFFRSPLSQAKSRLGVAPAPKYG